MKSLLQIAVSLALFACAAVLVSQGGYAWEALPPLEAWNVVGNYSWVQQEKRLGEQLTAQHEATLARMTHNNQISRQVLEGRGTLRQAAAEFGEVNRDAEGMWETYASQHADWSKQQLCAWGVIKGVEEILVQEGQDSTETVALLVAEVELWDDAEGGR